MFLLAFKTIKWAAPCENVSSGTSMRTVSAQSDQGLHCPLTESLDTTKCINRDQRPAQYFAQDYLNLRILHGAAHIGLVKNDLSRAKVKK